MYRVIRYYPVIAQAYWSLQEIFINLLVCVMLILKTNLEF